MCFGEGGGWGGGDWGGAEWEQPGAKDQEEFLNQAGRDRAHGVTVASSVLIVFDQEQDNDTSFLGL